MLHLAAAGRRAADGDAAMQLVEAGALDLDAPVGDPLPELAAPRTLDRPACAPIMLRRLLTHMSGSGYESMNPVSMAARGADRPLPAGAPEDWEFCSGGADLYGTAPDYIRLLRMLLRRGELDGTRILRTDTVAAMWDNQVGDLPAGRLDNRISRARPAL